MTKNELIEITKDDMRQEELPLLESENYSDSDIEFKWSVEEDSNDVSITVGMKVFAEGNCVNTRHRKIYLLEE